MARAVPEILYFRCPVCAKRFPGTAFGTDDLQAECEACGALVDSPHVIPAPNDRVTDSPFTLAEIAHEVTPAAGQDAQTQDITEQLRQAFDTLSQIDKAKFLEETLPTVQVPAVQDDGTGRRTVHLIVTVALLAVGTALLVWLYSLG